MIVPLQEQLLHKIPQLPTNMQIKGSHLWFYIDYMVTFSNWWQEWILTPKCPRIELLFMIVSPEDQFFTLRPIQRICSFTSFIQSAQ